MGAILTVGDSIREEKPQRLDTLLCMLMLGASEQGSNHQDWKLLKELRVVPRRFGDSWEREEEMRKRKSVCKGPVTRIPDWLRPDLPLWALWCLAAEKGMRSGGNPQAHLSSPGKVSFTRSFLGGGMSILAWKRNPGGTGVSSGKRRLCSGMETGSGRKHGNLDVDR